MNDKHFPPSNPTKTVAESDSSTVIAEFTRDTTRPRPTAKQSELALETAFMDALVPVGYEKVIIRNEADLLANLRVQLNKLNKTTYSDAEFQQILDVHLANPALTQAQHTQLIQQKHPLVTITLDKGQLANVKLIDTKNLMANTMQVTNQYRATTTTNARQRYDVTVLVNGLPLVHIELKRRGVSLKEAFTQIKRYQHSFQAGSKLFGFVQLFVISNGTDTKYYSNTTRDLAVRANTGKSKEHADKSFAFTSYWADARNNVINDLFDFAQTFMVKKTLLRILTRYCIFDASENLLVMRPYQIAATEAILDRITATANTKLLGTPDAGGFIWHTTGSGKTLTSFKTAQLATQFPGIDKVIFAVDRQDLDYQTVKEYERFQEGAVSSNTKTEMLKKQLDDNNATIIVTTIQKLNHYVKSKGKGSRYPGHVVLIFDECHRSQFGAMHTAIAHHFNKRHSFGFTGTPIFDEIARKDAVGNVFTTEAVFGKRLHTYTIVDAIRDGNVLRFKIDSHKTLAANVQEDQDVRSIDKEEALLSKDRITKVTEHILSSFPRYTKRSKSFVHSLSFHDRSTDTTTREDRRVSGFNAIFATSSITAARMYYKEFKTQQEGNPNALKIAMIYSQSQGQDKADAAAGAIQEESYDVDSLKGEDKKAYEQAVADYNAMFNTNFKATSSSYENFYKDLSQRIRNRELDLVIVVNIFLTGFDAPALNTLYVDKNLRHHGLVQAFSRTNRILNPIKDAGMIVTYRDLSEETDEALTMFGDRDKSARVSVIRPYAELFKEYTEFVEQVQAIAAPGELIHSEAKKKEFVEAFSALLRHYNVLQSFEEFEQQNPLSEYDLADYMSRYLGIRDELSVDDDTSDPDDPDKSVSILDDLEFEIELVRHIAVTLDYIAALIEKSRGDDGDIDPDDETKVRRLIDSSPHLRSKKDLVLAFVARVNGEGYDGTLVDFLRESAGAEITESITQLNLAQPAAFDFVAKSFALNSVPKDGKALINLLPPVSLFSKDKSREVQKRKVVKTIQTLIDRFNEVIAPDEIRALAQ